MSNGPGIRVAILLATTKLQGKRYHNDHLRQYVVCYGECVMCNNGER